MAIKDVRNYYFTVLAQYLEEKQNLADFEEALKNGHITEDQMREAQEIVLGLEENYYRLTYIMYLLEMPNKAHKKPNYIQQNKVLLDAFKALGADEETIQKENFDALKHFKAVLNDLATKTD